MGSMTSGQKQAKKYTQQAVSQLQSGRADMLMNPLYLAGQERAKQYLANPQSFSPEIVAQMKAIATDAMRSQGDSATRAMGERAAAGGRFRSGQTGDMIQRAQLQIGQGIADQYRQIESQAALQKNVDLANAVNLGMSVMAPQYQWDRDIAGVYGGAAMNPIWQQPSPLAQVAGGLGSIGGTILAGAPWWGTAAVGAPESPFYYPGSRGILGGGNPASPNK